MKQVNLEFALDYNMQLEYIDLIHRGEPFYKRILGCHYIYTNTIGLAEIKLPLSVKKILGESDIIATLVHETLHAVLDEIFYDSWQLDNLANNQLNKVRLGVALQYTDTLQEDNRLNTIKQIEQRMNP